MGKAENSKLVGESWWGGSKGTQTPGQMKWDPLHASEGCVPVGSSMDSVDCHLEEETARPVMKPGPENAARGSEPETVSDSVSVCVMEGDSGPGSSPESS